MFKGTNIENNHRNWGQHKRHMKSGVKIKDAKWLILKTKLVNWKIKQ